MNFEQEKLAWKFLESPTEAAWATRNLQSTWSHPTLRALRRQLLFECGCWMLFLALYYTALDGDLRSTGLNAALVAGLLLLIGHGWLGYRLAARPIGAAPLRTALEQQLRKLRTYSLVSMGLRTAILLIVFAFLLDTVPDLWAAPWLWITGTIAIWIIAALYIQHRIWRSRLRNLRRNLDDLTG